MCAVLGPPCTPVDFEVDDIEAAVQKLSAEGARILGKAKTGAHGKPVVFVHPLDFLGTLIGLEQV
jgi:methylmalonyl-CoA/ethylmalonyl-CoA epimerase